MLNVSVFFEPLLSLSVVLIVIAFYIHGYITDYIHRTWPVTEHKMTSLSVTRRPPGKVSEFKKTVEVIMNNN